jgi:hypothetical protein
MSAKTRHDTGKLDDVHNVLPATFDEYCEVMHPRNADKRRVAVEEVNGLLVSTVFLAMDHSFGHGSQLWFETMVFGGDDEHQRRYETWDDAVKGHAEVVAELRRAKP